MSVLKILARSSNQDLLRSTLVCNRRLHSHHAGYERDSQNPKVAFNYLLVWSSWLYWISNYVIKAFQDAFYDRKWINYVGLEDCSHCPSPLLGEQDWPKETPASTLTPSSSLPGPRVRAAGAGPDPCGARVGG